MYHFLKNSYQIFMLMLVVVCIPRYGASRGGTFWTILFLSNYGPNFIFKAASPVDILWGSTLDFIFIPFGKALYPDAVDLALWRFWTDLPDGLLAWMFWCADETDFGCFAPGWDRFVNYTFFITSPFFQHKWAIFPLLYLIVPSPCFKSFLNEPSYTDPFDHLYMPNPCFLSSLYSPSYKSPLISADCQIPFPHLYPFINSPLNLAPVFHLYSPIFNPYLYLCHGIFLIYIILHIDHHSQSIILLDHLSNLCWKFH